MTSASVDKRRGSSLVLLIASVISGAICATGFQPLALWPASLAAIAALIALISRAASPGRAFLIGWAFGVGYFTVGNSWIATAFQYQAEMPASLGALAVFLLALYLAVYPGLASLLAWALFARSGRRASILPVALAGAWIVAEMLRGTVFSGYAWNPLAMAALGPFDRPGLAVIAPWLGTYALSGFVVLIAGLWWFAVRALVAHRTDWRGWIAAALPPLLFLMPWPTAGTGEGTLAMTLVQPDIRQDILNDPSQYENQFLKIASLSLPLESGEPRLVLWPESGVPDYLEPGYPARFYRQNTFAADPALARARIAQVIGPDSLLLTGTVDLVIGPDDRAVAAENVVTAVAPDGNIAGSYAKSHLVPYGEYLPMREVLEPLGLSRLVAGTLDFRPGPGPRTIELGPWGRAGVQICYEIVFSGEVVDPANRPEYLVNPSNDGWFGVSGPPQHLAQARMRAIEEGLPILRSTTTGISAVIDAGGIVRHSAPMLTADRIDTRVPPARAPTAFALLGNWLPLGWAVLLLAFATWFAVRGGVRRRA